MKLATATLALLLAMPSPVTIPQISQIRTGFALDEYVEVGGATNGSSKMLGNKLAACFDVDGFASLAAAIAAIGVTPGVLRVKSPVALASNVTIPATLALLVVNGGYVTTTGYTLTIAGPILAGTYKIFNGTGTVAFTTPVSEVFPEWWGAVADNSTDCSFAIQSAIRAISTLTGDSTTFRSRGTTVVINPGTWYCSTTIYVDRCVRIMGRPGGAYGGAVTIRFAAGVYGFIIWNAGLGTAPSPTNSGADCHMLNLMITATSKTAAANGISALQKCRLTNVWVSGFKTHAFYFQSAIGASPAWCQQPGTETIVQANGTYGGTNSSMIEYCNATSCDGDGLRIVGGDSNGITTINLTCQNCSVGLNDQSAIGGCHINFLPEGNTLAGIRTATEAGNCTVIGSNLAEGNGTEDNYASGGTIFIGCIGAAVHAGTNAMKNFRAAGGIVLCPTLEMNNPAGGTGLDKNTLSYFYAHGTAFMEFWGDASNQQTQLRLEFDTTLMSYFFDIQSAYRALEIFTNATTNADFKNKLGFRNGAVGPGGYLVLGDGGGTPEGRIAAPVGSQFTNTAGGAGTVFYVKESGSGNTGWAAK